jgi:23S rRNA pseudouridine1911/1915/1917 synthase
LRLQTIFQDDHVIVVDKPAGLLTIATETERERTLYVQVREAIKKKIFIVHRLDREASGLVVMAKTAAAKEKLQNQFKDHSAGRGYIAVVEGRVLPDAFTIRSYLAENAIHRVYVTKNAASGKLAVTHVSVVKRSPRTSLLEVRLETGRKHQIRVQLADRGNPIVGDKLYGSRSNPLRRLALHGGRLEFRHPHTDKLMRFESPYPKAFDSL